MAMLRQWIVLGLVALLLAGAAGCGTDGESETDSSGDTMGDAAPDGTSDTSADPGPDIPVDPEFVVGLNQVFETAPEYFTPLLEGDTVPIVLGPQASNMVVLSFKTRGIFERSSTFRVVGRMTIDGVLEGELERVGQNIFPGGDGYDYYYNFWLAIAPVEVPTGAAGFIEFSVEDETTGHIETAERNVIVGMQE